MSSNLTTRFTQQVGIEIPIICGAMFPCSNPELVAAVSEAGGIGIIQPLSFVYVYGRDFKAALDDIRSRTSKPFGMNVIVEKSSRVYEERMRNWVDIALANGCKFFITALGNPSWVVEKAHAHGALVYHNTTELKWAKKALSCGVDGLVCVNNAAGGHAGDRNPAELFAELKALGVPMICAGGVGDKDGFCSALDLGYDGVQMGTRFIATHECGAHSDYKEAILKARAEDIVLTERVTTVPLSVIRTPHVEAVGLKLGPISRLLFRFKRTRDWLRMLYAMLAARSMRRSALKGLSSKDYYQAGKSVEGITSIESAGDVVKEFWNEYKTRKSA